MLASHMAAKEQALVAISKIPANSGHPLHKGTPREAFIKEFLESHLPSNVDIGTGEIIDSESKPNESRNQFDIVVHRKSYPKLDFGGSISGFLVESVIATIEVKSALTNTDLEQAIKAARASKQLSPHFVSSFSTGYVPPRILNYVVAYDGPASMQTVYGWIPQIYSKLEIPSPNLPEGDQQRIETPSESIDGVFVLQKGFLYFDNTPLSFGNATLRKQTPTSKWLFADSANGNLLLFFLLIQSATANIEGRWLDSVAYLKNVTVNDLKYRF